MITFHLEASLIYVSVMEAVLDRFHTAGPSNIRPMICDLSAAPYLDLASSRTLHELYSELVSRGIAPRIVGAHGSEYDLLRAGSIEDIGRLDCKSRPLLSTIGVTGCWWVLVGDGLSAFDSSATSRTVLTSHRN